MDHCVLNILKIRRLFKGLWQKNRPREIYKFPYGTGQSSSFNEAHYNILMLTDSFVKGTQKIALNSEKRISLDLGILEFSKDFFRLLVLGIILNVFQWLFTIAFIILLLNKKG